MARRAESCCAVFVHMPARLRRLLGPGKWLAIPALVVGEVGLPLAPEVLATKSVKDDFRRMRKSELRFAVTQNTEDLEDFWHNMHRPYIRQTHGDSAFVVPYDRMREQFSRCDLLLVSKQGKTIAGLLIRYSDAGPSLWSLGVRDGDRQFVRDGAIGALYHFSFRHLLDRGFTTVGLGNSRAFLSDGALQYKKKLGMRLTATFQPGAYFYFRALRDTQATRAILRANPFVFESDGRLCSVVVADPQDGLPDEEYFRRAHKEFYIKGMSRLFVVPLDAPGGGVTVPSDLADRMSVGSASEVFGWER